MTLVDPICHLLTMRPGSALWARVAGHPQEIPTPQICARLERGETEMIPKYATVEHRACAWTMYGVCVICWMAQISGRPEWTFETWINVQAQTMPNPLPDLSAMASLGVLLFEDNDTPTRALRVTNNIDWVGIRTTVEALPPWTMQDFDDARSIIYARHDTVQKLWEALTDGQTNQD